MESSSVIIFAKNTDGVYTWDPNAQYNQEQIEKLNVENYRDEKIIIRGCSTIDVPVSAYVELINRLRPVAKSIMYGDACSTVPLFKKPN